MAQCVFKVGGVEYAFGDVVEVEGSKYGLGRFLGSGGFGAVYEAFDPDLNVKALKIYHEVGERTSGLLLDAFSLRRDVATLSPFECALPEAVEQVNGVVKFVVMNLLKGSDLDDSDSLLFPKSDVDLVSFLRLAVYDLFAKLVKLIDVGVVHGDFKFSNVVFDEKTMNFGLIDFDVFSRSGKQKSYIVGTPFSMAPEYYSKKYISSTVDVFALAVEISSSIKSVREHTGLLNSTVICRTNGLFASDKEPALRVLRDWGRYPEEVRNEIAGLVEFIIAGLNINPNARPKTMEEVDQLLDFVPNLSMV
ncbi:hypothetical protein COU74_03985 [Candidatus Peregrinibacteria bacterium CG10_big_fil_rev_8_21_14_0_10_36_19]|nr:MAG: hypothetical protein COU74_03985 [Candidatus Peregrinibacteria bacterium CG10_big_fil_rev_8_21_14_0_10_36_19]